MMNASSSDGRIADFDRFVRAGSHPCVMARSVMTRQAARFGRYAELGTEEAARALCGDLQAALKDDRRGDAPWSFVALFAGAPPRDEAEFETALWNQLQLMHDCDIETHAWDPSVDSDPAAPKFSFSIGGRAWYVIGLHPAASRLARRFDSVALVFNPHSQFERLRAQGKYETIKDRIRERDAAVQGSINPMLADHGERSEARQYSGRAVSEAWRCPFRQRAAS